MGMDVIGTGLSYNWTGWRWLIGQLDDWGVDTSELSTTNDGDPISIATCRAIADALESHLHELSYESQLWLESHIEAWRNCTFAEQW